MNINSTNYSVSEDDELSNKLDVINYDKLSYDDYANILNLLCELNEYLDRIILKQKTN